MNKLKTLKISSLVALLIFFGNDLVFAEKDSPENVILSAANSLFTDVEKNKKLYENDITAFYERVDNILSPIIDFDVLIKSIIGKKNYQETSSEQKSWSPALGANKIPFLLTPTTITLKEENKIIRKHHLIKKIDLNMH